MPTRRALVLSGGGARAAYQSGVLEYIAQSFPTPEISIYMGVSAGSINTTHLANHPGTYVEATEDLVASWRDIAQEHVFESTSSFALIRRLISRSSNALQEISYKALLDTAPLRSYLEGQFAVEDGELVGIQHNLQKGRLTACAVTATNYGTGQSVTWVQGQDIETWERPNRLGVQTRLTVDHILASTSLPLLFPAVRIGDAWYGDGGIRLSSPLSPVLHMGATRILVISTRYDRSRREADDSAITGYPPAAQIIGVLMNAIFLDVLDQDARNLERINKLLKALPPRKRQGMRPVDLLLIRPSKDLGRLASEYEINITGALRLLTRSLGSSETKSPDWLSMLLFEPAYINHLIELGWKDARDQHHRIEAFFADEKSPALVNGLKR